MYNLIWADLFKLRKSLTIKILFVISTISAVTMSIMAYFIQQGKIDSSMTGIGFMFSDVNMMTILGAVIAGVLICGDFDNKTIRDAVASGSSRGTIIISKTVVFFCAIAFLLLPYALTTGIALGTGYKFSMGSIAIGFLNLLASESGTAFSSAGILKLLAVMLTLIVVYWAQLSICIPLALLLKKPVLVVAINYGFSILCAQLMSLRGRTALFDGIFASTPFGGEYAFITLDTSFGYILQTIAVSFIFMLVMLTITYCGFRKSEIK